MKKQLLACVMLAMVPAVASAQTGWTFDRVFPDSTSLVNTAHGIAIDGENKVWIGPYNSSILQAATQTTLAVRRNFVRVYNANGTEASFSPIVGAMVGDSLLRFGPITGLSQDHDGNVWVSAHGFRVNSATEDGGVWNQRRSWVHKFSPSGATLFSKEVSFMRTETATHAPNRVGVTTDGNFFVSFVWSASPIKIYSGIDGAEIGTVANESQGFSRSLAVSPDGKWVFDPTYDKNTITAYYSADGVFGEYAINGDITYQFTGLFTGAIHTYPPNPTILYAAAAGGDGNPLAAAPWNNNRWYGISTASGNVLDSLSWNYGTRTAFVIPRALAISADGLTMYLGTFSTGTPAVQKFTRQSVVSVDRTSELANEFKLSQNYPNPFNPSTRISFTLPQAGDVTLKVYDMLGREVASLVSGNMPMGSHSVNFDASGLSSGIYLYELRSGNVRITNKMTLMK